MPERWQDELKKLRREEMPDGVRDRAEAGPRRELPNDGRQRLIAGVVAFVVFAAAGAYAWRAFDRAGTAGSEPTPSPDAPTAVVTLVGSDPEYPAFPHAVLSFGADRVDGQAASYGWDTAIIDTETPSFKHPLALPEGTLVQVQGDAGSVEISVISGTIFGRAEHHLEASPDGFELPLAMGEYFLEVTGTWPKGSVQFYFPIAVRAATSVVIALNGTTEGPSASLTSGDQTQEGVRESYGWCNSEDCTGADADYAHYPPVNWYVPVVPGTSFESEGDGELTRLVVRTTDGSYESANVVLDSDGTGATVPAEPGRYAVWISATWGDRGSATFYFGIEVLPAIDDVPDILHLTCTPERATLDGTIVQVQADGLHLSVDASADVAGADLITGTTPEEFFGVGLDERDDGRDGIPISPGEWGVGCYEGTRGAVGPSDFGTPRVASFTIVDPFDRFAETDLACSDPETTDGVTGLPVGPSPTAGEVSDVLVGLGVGDVVREGGYDDADGFKLGPTYVVQRNGETIARVTLGWSDPEDAQSGWKATIETCPGAGIHVASTGTSNMSDVLRLTCDPDGTHAESTTVQAQVDGVHILVAENAAGIDNVMARPDDPDPWVAYSSGSDGVDDEFAPEMDPGPWLVECGSSAEVDPEHMSDPWPGSVRVEVAGPTIYRANALSCPSADAVQLSDLEGRGHPSEDAVRVAVDGILPSDVVERSGYFGSVDAAREWWRVVRDGDVVGAFFLSPSGDHILFAIGTACAGSGIGGA